MKISVIVPVYNTKNCLARCLDSLLEQDFADFEILCVNDGSTDKSAALLAEYEKKFPEKLSFFTKENGGLSDARNFGIARARGEFLAFVDSDDWVAKNFLSRLYETALEKKADVVGCDFYYALACGKLIYAPLSKKLSDDPVREALLAAPMACMRLIRRDLLLEEGFTKGIFFEDLERIPRLALQTDRFAFCSEALYFYYQRENSIMKQNAFSEKQFDIFRVLDSVRSHFAAAGKADFFKDELEFLHIEHLLRSAGLRFAALGANRKTFSKLIATMKEHYPDWRNNPYYKRAGRPFRLAVALTAKKQITALRLLQKIRK